MNPTEGSSTSTNIPSTPPTSPPPAANPPAASEASPRQGSGSNSNAPNRRPPQMGVPGQSAFSAYTRPLPPPPPPPAHLLPPGPSRPTGSSFTGGLIRVRGAQAVAVGAGGAGLNVGGNIPAARKRGRDAGASGNNPAAAEVENNPVSCSICGKEFSTPKALFGHMRSHPGRGWRGARPPPTFSAEEEFADLRAAAAALAAAAAEEGGGGAAEEEEGKNFRLPDLNNPPPPEDDSN